MNNILIAGLFLSLAPLALAQDSTTASEDEDLPRWYEVELFVFANNNPDPASLELWNQELGLKYPSGIVALKTLTEELPLDPAQDIPNQAQLAFPDNSSDHSDSPLGGEESPASVDPRPASEQAYILLEEELRQLTPSVQRILRQADFRLLFHQAWRQPIGKRGQSDSILIQGGELFDRHYELEGSINLSIERYLHINTDLWLSTFVSNVGREQTPWPILPPVPLQLLREDPASGQRTWLAPVKPDAEQSAANSFANGSYNNTDFNNTDFTNPRFPQNNSATNNYGSGGMSSGEWSSSGYAPSPENSLSNLFMDLINNQYAVERTIALRQHRRMRSKELHYIDHPLMGLLIKITPYELPVPEPVVDEPSLPESEIELEQQPTPAPAQESQTLGKPAQS